MPRRAWSPSEACRRSTDVGITAGWPGRVLQLSSAVASAAQPTSFRDARHAGFQLSPGSTGRGAVPTLRCGVTLQMAWRECFVSLATFFSNHARPRRTPGWNALQAGLEDHYACVAAAFIDPLADAVCVDLLVMVSSVAQASARAKMGQNNGTVETRYTSLGSSLIKSDGAQHIPPLPGNTSGSVWGVLPGTLASSANREGIWVRRGPGAPERCLGSAADGIEGACQDCRGPGVPQHGLSSGGDKFRDRGDQSCKALKDQLV